MKTVIVLPTYNEAENIEELLHKVFKTIDFETKILVVDDYSPDKTAEIVFKLQQQYENLYIIQKKERGLGKAYIKGFEYAINNLDAEILIEMDSDFSHDPKKIPELLREIQAGADFVIGSRYIKGGSIPKEWAFIRKINSKYGNLFARFIAGLKDVKDCTSGFRAIRADFIKKINLDELNVRGYSFQMNILFECVQLGAKVVEIPLNFVDRTKGKSKLGIEDAIEFMINSFKLLKKRLF